MKEAEILFRISQIVNATDSFTGAVEHIRSLLELALGAQALALLGTSDLPDRASFKGDVSLRTSKNSWSR